MERALLEIPFSCHAQSAGAAAAAATVSMVARAATAAIAAATVTKEVQLRILHLMAGGLPPAVGSRLQGEIPAYMHTPEEDSPDTTP